ncbi:MAG TPA: SDR family oxidoreductase, partial [Acidimicrobiales bacterium]|nr:SDR family oxidoreductase [Acidimicrobiales bacterium]
ADVATVAVVTGAARGMGRASIDALIECCDVIVAVDLEPPDIAGTIGVGCDVSDRDAVQALVERVAELGTFRALVHAAGISPTMADARRVVEVDLIGTQLLLDAFDPLVVDGSAAVCFASLSAHLFAPFVTPELDAALDDPLAADFLDGVAAASNDNSSIAYGFAKIGVIRAAARAAVAWGPRGGRVNSVSPGLIDTPQGRQELAHQPAMRTLLEQTPLGRLGRPEEVIAAVAFLISDAASFVSGVDLPIDGALVPNAKVPIG